MSEMQGVVRGRTIELDDETGFPDGQKVAVSVQPIENPLQSREPGNCRGMLVIVAEDDEHLADFREYME